VPWFAFGKTSKQRVTSFGKLSGWFMGFSVLKMLLLSSDKVMLGYLAGPRLVSNYALTMFTSTALQGGMIAIITGMTPGICTVFGKGEFDKVKQLTPLPGCFVLLLVQLYYFLIIHSSGFGWVMNILRVIWKT
jgi:O-antigen/teichoic acid export membrane protein